MDTPREDSKRTLDAGRALLQWLLLGSAAGAACGVASAAFLLLLDRATAFRVSHEWLVYFLPVGGLAVGFVGERWGASIRGGSSLVIDSVHEDSPRLPLRMAPLALLGTVLTHLLGGSAGREGTAVQMGASLADQLAHRLGVSKETRRQLLAAGIAGGFGSVFGTPVAGTIFGLEVVCVGVVEYHALLPALVASVVGDLVTRSLGVVHTAYPAVAPLGLTPLVAAKWLVVAVAVAATSAAFVELTHALRSLLEARVPRLPLRAFLAGAAVVGLWKLAGTSDYLGLGVPSIVGSFTDPSLPWFAFAAKLVFTAVTLAGGFVGGEVTPLFFVGATLGATLGRALGLPLDLAAGVGLAAVFAASANTPLALSVMAVELCGASVLPHVMIVAAVAYLVTGHRGIYPTQRIGRLKSGGPPLEKLVPLGDLHRPPPPSPPA